MQDIFSLFARAGIVDRENGELVLQCKLKIALIACGHTNDGSGSISHQYIISDPDRDFMVCDGVVSISTGPNSIFLFS